MKNTQYLAIFSFVTLLSLSCSSQVSSKQPIATVQPSSSLTATSTAPSQTLPKNQPSMAENPMISGSFVSAEHPTEGRVEMISENGKRYLQFSSDFKTDNGPSLDVILYRTDMPPISGLAARDYLNLGNLQSINGTQRYEIPTDVNLADYGSVAIWCRQFNATFGYAALMVNS